MEKEMFHLEIDDVRCFFVVYEIQTSSYHEVEW